MENNNNNNEVETVKVWTEWVDENGKWHEGFKEVSAEEYRRVVEGTRTHGGIAW